MVVVVQDVQDMPPVFTSAPPVTHLPRQVAPRDVVVKVRAEDGDKGAPRQIRYGLVSEGNPFTPFFNINETTGKFLSNKYVTFKLIQDVNKIVRNGESITLITLRSDNKNYEYTEAKAMKKVP